MSPDLSQPVAANIHGVEFKHLVSHPDDRGFFREIIRSSDQFFSPGFGQWSHSKMALNTVKAWHYHHKQYDWWYLGLGVINVVLFDNREESSSFRQKMEFKLGDPELDPEANVAVVKIPPGVMHGCKVLSDTAHLFYITSELYDPNDEGRLPFDSIEVPHSWGNSAELIISARDRKAFVPLFDRQLVEK